MSAELEVLNGMCTGRRFTLGHGEFRVGRSADSDFSIAEERDSAWEHFTIRQTSDGYLLRDKRTGMGTFVNGKRSKDRLLEDGDYIQVGDTAMQFHAGAPTTLETTSAPTAADRDSASLFLEACGTVFLFRMLASTAGTEQQAAVKQQLLRLVSSHLPLESGTILVSDTLDGAITELRSQNDSEWQSTAVACWTQGQVCDARSGVIAFPFQCRGTNSGLLLLRLKPDGRTSFEQHCSTASAIATLGSMALESTLEVRALRERNEMLEASLSGDCEIVGDSPPMIRLLEMVRRVAATDTTVLILGESGTGKELVARRIHGISSRSKGPFVAVNCAALTETLLESDLFGHERGAFTGAITQKKGRFEVAGGGTLFLDEIGEMALALQAKLLRVLQQREFQRVGGTETRKLDVRVIAATNRNLTDDVCEGRFREDLYHRLNVVALKTPALRDRPWDIPALAQALLAKASRRCKRNVVSISPEALRLLMNHGWPGNVRELENAIERAVALGSEETVLPEDLPETLLEAAAQKDLTAFQASVADAKRESILHAYRDADGDYKQAAEQLGIHPNYLLRLVKNLGLKESIRAAKRAAKAI